MTELKSIFYEKHSDLHPKNPFAEAILWRQKEQFSDGVGYNWIDTLIEYYFKS